MRIRFLAVSVTVRKRIFAFYPFVLPDSYRKIRTKNFSEKFENLVGIGPLATLSIVEGVLFSGHTMECESKGAIIADMQNGTRKIGCYGAYENTRVSRSTVALTEDMVRTLAQKYDVTHMNRNEYSLLLYDLRSAGVITTQEFSAGYGGTLPHASVPVEKSPETMPLGNNRADFAELLKQYMGYCGEFLKASAGHGLEQEHSRSLLDAYSHLYMLFKQVHSVRLEFYTERGGSD